MTGSDGFSLLTHKCRGKQPPPDKIYCDEHLNSARAQLKHICTRLSTGAGAFRKSMHSCGSGIQSDEQSPG